MTHKNLHPVYKDPDRVGRGGSWHAGAQDARAARRSNWPPGCRYGFNGLRLVHAA